MKINSVNTVYDLMHYCHAPMWYQREVRDMRVGDIFFLGQYKELIDTDDDIALVGEAWIEKERGVYKFYATWTIPSKPSRSFVMTHGSFKVLKGGIVNFGNDRESFRLFALVSRYLNRILMKMSLDEREVYYKAGTKPLLRGVCIDKDLIGRRSHYVKDNESLRRIWINYENYLPTNPLQAIITAGIAFKQF